MLLDFDGTIVGDVQWLATEQSMINMYNTNKSHSKIRYLHTFVHNDLNTNLLRPHFDIFIKSMKRNYPNVEFFIYTASDPTWAEFIVSKVETKIGFKFNRPLFTRSNCQFKDGRYHKSLQAIKPVILKKLARDYNIKNENDIGAMILIDNTQNVLEEHKEHQVLCPSYDYKYPIDLLRQVPPSILENAIPHFMPKSLTIARTSSYQKRMAMYYRYISILYQQAYKNNKLHKNDIYFKYLLKRCLETNINAMNSYTLKEWLTINK